MSRHSRISMQSSQSSNPPGIGSQLAARPRRRRRAPHAWRYRPSSCCRRLCIFHGLLALLVSHFERLPPQPHHEFLARFAQTVAGLGLWVRRRRHFRRTAFSR